jgi:hypothetical protein
LGNGNKITFNRNYFKLEHQIFGWSYLQQTGEISEILGTFIYARAEEIKSGFVQVTIWNLLLCFSNKFERG